MNARALKDEPKRAKLLTDTELPMTTKSTIETAEPIRLSPTTENAEPKRATCLSDKVLPMFTKSTIDSAEPIRAKLLMDSEAPRWM